MDIGSGELLVIAIVLLIVLVPTKVPQLARSIGEAMSELRKARDESSDARPTQREQLVRDESGDTTPAQPRQSDS